jgi:50S ribosomal protein L16 3-hydroxylase
MLFEANCFYLNSEAAKFTGDSAEILNKLADNRHLKPNDISSNGHLHKEIDTQLLQQLHAWYIAGYLYFDI